MKASYGIISLQRVPAQEGNRAVDFGVHHDVVLYKRHFFAEVFQELFKDGGCFGRTTEFYSLGGIHQLDGQDKIEVIHDLEEFDRGIRTHADVILLSVAGYDRVAAGGIAVHFVLAHHARGCILRDHKTGVQTGIGNKEFGQAAKSHDQLSHTPFGDITQFGQGNSQEIVRDRQRLAVEVSAGDDLVLVRENGRVVCH